MLLQPDSVKYPLSIRILHWLIALLIIALLIVGFVMTNMPHTDPRRALLFNLHKTFGVTVLALAVLRLIIRLWSTVPSLPVVIPKIQQHLAHLGHCALYGFMFLMPVSGYVMSVSYGLPVKWFGIPLPKLVGIDKARGELASSIHYYAAWALIALLALHIGAVILHYLHEQVNLLRRIW